MVARVVLVGPPGSGKTTIGRRLSSALNIPVVDTDELLAERHGMSCGEVLQQLGEPEFRRREEEAVEEALASSGIVSLGGGAVLSARTREALRRRFVVYLHITAEEGVQRTAKSTTRPLLNVDNPAERYQQLLAEREELYTEVASLKIRCTGKTPQRVATDVLTELENRQAEKRARRRRNRRGNGATNNYVPGAGTSADNAEDKEDTTPAATTSGGEPGVVGTADTPDPRGADSTSEHESSQ